MNLEELRAQIDTVDASIVELFQQRMDIAAQIAKYKQENGLPILQSAREREKLNAVSGLAREDMHPHFCPRPGAGKASRCGEKGRAGHGQLHPGIVFHAV